MLSETELAHKLHNCLSQTSDGYGKPTSVSTETQSYASGIIAALKAAVVSNAPGTISGVCAPGSPLSGGFGVGGLIVMTPAPMIAKTTGGFPGLSQPLLSKENVAIVTYLATGLVSFAAGNITGQCTNTAESPGPLTNGAGSGGKIIGITGAAAMAAVIAATGFNGPDMIKHYTALVDYIKDKAEVTYASGSVVGVCPSGGGPLGAGAGTGGTIS